jgi:serine/threonine-protein kinase RsbT
MDPMTIAEALRTSLRSHLSAISVESLIQRHVSAPNAPVGDTSSNAREELAERVLHAARLFSASDPALLRSRVRVALGLEEAAGTPSETQAPRTKLIEVRTELDVSVARNEARSLLNSCGWDNTLTVKVATAVSELARNIVSYAGTGSIALEVRREGEVPSIRVVATDAGPGIAPAQLESMLAGTYRSKSGLGKGLLGVKRMASDFRVNTVLGKGTTVQAVFRGSP